MIFLSTPNLCGNEQKYVSKAIEESWVSTAGGYINDFEKAVAGYVGVPSAAACQSGTAGLHLALLACGVQQGDMVIVPALTFIAAVNPVKYVGAEPIFMDCDDSLCMDMDKLRDFCEQECVMREGALYERSSGRRIRAVLVVHVFGNIADMEKLCDIAEKYNLKLIEDATEALGSKITKGRCAGRFAGTIGNVGVYSFNGNKIITTGGGGMVVSQDSDIVDRVRFLSTQAKADTLYFIHNEIGYNYRMTNIQAAVGLGQMELLDDFICIKNKNYDAYCARGVELLPFRADIRSNKWFYSYMCSDRDGLIKWLSENKVQSRPVWKLICDLPPYAAERRYKIEKARHYWEKIVNLPCSTHLTAEQVERVVSLILEFENK